jgi:hypothetical protein
VSTFFSSGTRIKKFKLNCLLMADLTEMVDMSHCLFFENEVVMIIVCVKFFSALGRKPVKQDSYK